MSLRTTSKYVGGLLLAAFLLWWVLRGVDTELLLERLADVSWAGLAACIVLNVGHNVFRVWRWRALLAPVREGVPFRPMFTAVILGYMFSWVLPGRVGELVRPMVLAGDQRLPLGPCLGSVVADRLLDGVSVVVLFGLGAMLTPLSGPAEEHAALIRSVALIALLAMVAFTAAMLLASRLRPRIERWLVRRWAPLRWIGRTTLSLAEGVRALGSPRLAGRIALHSALAWLTIAVATWLGIRAAGADIALAGVMFILPLLVLGVAVPTPGGAGSYHGLMKVGLLMFGVGEVPAIAAGLVVHAAITVPVILLGLVLLWGEGFSWRHLLDGARQLRDLGAPEERPPVAGAMESAP